MIPLTDEQARQAELRWSRHRFKMSRVRRRNRRRRSIQHASRVANRRS